MPNLGFFVLFLVFWFFLLNQMQNTGNKALSFGKSRARLHTDDKTKITFDDVAGADEAKEELVEIVEFLAATAAFYRTRRQNSQRSTFGWASRYRQDPVGQGRGR